MLRAGHLAPTLAVTAFTTVLAIDAGRGWGSAAVAAAVLCGQLTVGWSNDYIDRDRDRRIGRRDKPIVTGEVPAARVRRAALLAAGACVPLSLLSGWRAAGVHVAAVCLALTYNLWLKNTLLSVVPFALAFGSLPAFVVLGLHGHPNPHPWQMTAAGLLGAGAHFLNALPDLDDDAATGIRGLPHRLGPMSSLFVGVALIAGSATVVITTPRSAPSNAGIALAAVAFFATAGVALAAVRNRRRLAWKLCLLAAGATVALYVATP